MKSTSHPCLWNLRVVSSGRCLAITATVTALAVGSIFAQEYDEMNIVAPDDFFDIPTPSVDEYVTIGGFQLRIDRTK